MVTIATGLISENAVKHVQEEDRIAGVAALVLLLNTEVTTVPSWDLKWSLEIATKMCDVLVRLLRSLYTLYR